jgi:hypothetical protein
MVRSRTGQGDRAASNEKFAPIRDAKTSWCKGLKAASAQPLGKPLEQNFVEGFYSRSQLLPVEAYLPRFGSKKIELGMHLVDLTS